MAATAVQLNWSAVTHNSTSVTKVTSVTFQQGGQILEFAGDTDRYPTVMTAPMTRPRATVTTADVQRFMPPSITPGISGALVATHKDAKLASGGDVIYTLNNAVFEDATAQGQFGQYGSITANFRAFSSDGSTNPLSFTRA